MKRDVIRDFLNLPGIVGIALVDGRSRPFFLGIDQILNFQQKEALAQGIQQVVETTPGSFDFFEFQFGGHQIYIYKLEHGIILLVLTNEDLVYSDYAPIVSLLKLELQEDFSNAIANFRLAAGNITLNGQSYWKRDPALSAGTQFQAIPTSLSSAFSPATDTPPPTPSRPQNQGAASRPASTNGQSSPYDSSISTAPQGRSPQARPTQPNQASRASRLASPTPTSASLSQQKSAKHVPSVSKTGNNADTQAKQPDEVTLKEILAALNHLSKSTTHYLGATIVSNYWKSSRPAIDWLEYFEVDRSGQITFSGSMTPGKSDKLNPDQHQWLREWVDAFIQRCSKVIRDFSSVIQKMELSQNQRNLLLSEKR